MTDSELTIEDLKKAWKNLEETKARKYLCLTSDIYDLRVKLGLPVEGIIRVNAMEGTTNVD